LRRSHHTWPFPANLPLRQIKAVMAFLNEYAVGLWMARQVFRPEALRSQKMTARFMGDMEQAADGKLEIVQFWML
jgi:hypothetical protein